MQQWQLPAGASSPDELISHQVEVPSPGPGQVRVRVRAISINYRDQLILDGPFGRVPDQSLVPLSDVAGEVDAVGDGVEDWAIGDRVMTAHVPDWVDGPPPAFGIGRGSLDDEGVAAEMVLVEETALLRAPSNLDFAEAATLQVAGVTAWNALFGDHPVGPGDRVVTIGTGGVSLFSQQLALASGAEVYVALRNPLQNGGRVVALGATAYVDSSKEAWPAELAAMTGGATKVINTVGPAMVNDCLAALRPAGEVALLGLFEMTPPLLDFMTLLTTQGSIRGVAVGSKRMHQDLADFVAAHDVHPVIDVRIPFDHLPDAYRAQRSADVFGKVVVEV